MKKLGLIGLFSLCVFTLADAKTRSIQASERHHTQGVSSVAAFDTLAVHGQTEVIFKQADPGTYTVDISGPENLVAMVETISEEGTLSVHYKEPLLVQGDHHVKVSVAAPVLKEIRVQESGEVQTIGNLETEELKLVVNGKGEIDIDHLQTGTLKVHTSGEGEIDINSLTCQYLQVQAMDSASFDAQQALCDTVHIKTSNRAEVSLSGIKSASTQVESHHASGVELKGKAEVTTLTARGRSEVDAGALQAEKADVIAENAAKVEVRVSDTLNAETQGRGKVAYKGWPQQINTSGKANIRRDK